MTQATGAAETGEDQGGSGAARRLHAVILALACALCFVGLGRSLWTPDEPREAEIGREMWLSPGIVPTLNGRPFVEKPPLYYWAVAAAYAAAGGPSPAAARSVSAVASALTLLLVFLWGRRACSPGVGVLAAVGLATSLQFAESAHWVLIDPLLMLVTTAAAFGGWELLNGGPRGRALVLLYGGAGVALWIKGFIGPVLLGAGLTGVALFERSTASWRTVYSTAGVIGFGAVLALLPAALYLEGGAGAVREWFWVNHVERFLHPEGTGHEQPLAFYLWTLPQAALPWLVPLLDALRPRHWRPGTPHLHPRRFWAAMALGMLLVLSASVTKRGIYLLPVLPIVALLAAARVEQWWLAQRRTTGAIRSPGWWVQVGLCAVFALAPTAVLLRYYAFGSHDPLAIAYLAVAVLLVAAIAVLSIRGAKRAAAGALLASALLSVAGLLSVASRVAGVEKDMDPYLQWVDRQLPAGAAVFATGIDESLEGIVPFVTGRRLVAADLGRLGEPPPAYLLVQEAREGHAAPVVHERYEMLGEHRFGPSRYLALWRRKPARPPAQ